MKIVITSKKPRNPLIVAARLRVAGRHLPRRSLRHESERNVRLKLDQLRETAR